MEQLTEEGQVKGNVKKRLVRRRLMGVEETGTGRWEREQRSRGDGRGRLCGGLCEETWKEGRGTENKSKRTRN